MEIVLSVVFRMTQQQKVRQGGPKPCHCSNQRGGIFKCRAQLGSCWDGLRLSFLNFKRIYVEGDPTEIVINWAKLFAWPCVSKHTAMKTNFGTSGPCLQPRSKLLQSIHGSSDDWEWGKDPFAKGKGGNGVDSSVAKKVVSCACIRSTTTTSCRKVPRQIARTRTTLVRRSCAVVLPAVALPCYTRDFATAGLSMLLAGQHQQFTAQLLHTHICSYLLLDMHMFISVHFWIGIFI